MPFHRFIFLGQSSPTGLRQDREGAHHSHPRPQEDVEDGAAGALQDLSFDPVPAAWRVG